MRTSILVSLYFTLLCLFHSSYSQPTKDASQAKNHYGSYGKSQWWIGLNVGINKNKGFGNQTYTTATILSNDDSPKKTSYGAFNDIGWSLGIDISYELSFLTFSSTPMFRSSSFDYSWTITRSSGSETITDIYNQATRIQSYSLPLTIRYVFLKQKKFKPSLFLGGYLDLVNFSLGTIHTQEIQTSGSSSTVSEESFLNSIVISDKLSPLNYGVFGGIGFSYDINDLRIGMDISYRLGLSNMAAEDTRFNDNELNTIDGVLDDFKLHTIQLAFTVSMPLKYIYSRYYKRVK